MLLKRTNNPKQVHLAHLPPTKTPREPYNRAYRSKQNILLQFHLMTYIFIDDLVSMYLLKNYKHSFMAHKHHPNKYLWHNIFKQTHHHHHMVYIYTQSLITYGHPRQWYRWQSCQVWHSRSHGRTQWWCHSHLPLNSLPFMLIMPLERSNNDTWLHVLANHNHPILNGLHTNRHDKYPELIWQFILSHHHTPMKMPQKWSIIL